MKFEDLTAWQKARELTNAVYALCSEKPLVNDFGLRDRLQRAAVSAMTNIAEGFERSHSVEKMQYWNIARASAGEVRSLLYVVIDNRLAPVEMTERIQQLAPEVSALTKGLINSFKDRHLRED